MQQVAIGSRNPQDMTGAINAAISRFAGYTFDSIVAKSDGFVATATRTDKDGNRFVASAFGKKREDAISLLIRSISRQ